MAGCAYQVVVVSMWRGSGLQVVAGLCWKGGSVVEDRRLRGAKDGLTYDGRGEGVMVCSEQLLSNFIV